MRICTIISKRQHIESNGGNYTIVIVVVIMTKVEDGRTMVTTTTITVTISTMHCYDLWTFVADEIRLQFYQTLFTNNKNKHQQTNK